MFDKPHLSQNRTMLWHGTKTENLMGILQNGMIIDAPHAVRCGSAYGNGIYLADTFQKSFSYSTSPNIGYGYNSASKNANYKYMLLCEAAIGKIRVKHSARYYYNPYTNSNSQVNYVSFIDQIQGLLY